jgi:hypothetical protein
MSASVQASFVDVIHSPWCFIEAPEESFKRAFEARWGVTVREFNLWEIEDDELSSLPTHVARTVAALRAGEDLHAFGGGGSLFFLDGRRLDLSPALKWPQVERILASRQQGGGG